MPRWLNENRPPLAKVRVNAGFSMEKAAVAVNITSRTLARYENGISDVPMRIANKLAELYKVPFETIRQAVQDTWLSQAGEVAHC